MMLMIEWGSASLQPPRGPVQCQDSKGASMGGFSAARWRKGLPTARRMQLPLREGLMELPGAELSPVPLVGHLSVSIAVSTTGPMATTQVPRLLEDFHSRTWKLQQSLRPWDWGKVWQSTISFEEFRLNGKREKLHTQSETAAHPVGQHRAEF